jgi:hypothetical protein
MKFSTDAKDSGEVSPAVKRRKQRRGRRSSPASAGVERDLGKTKARRKMIWRGGGLLFIAAGLP